MKKTEIISCEWNFNRNDGLYTDTEYSEFSENISGFLKLNYFCRKQEPLTRRSNQSL